MNALYGILVLIASVGALSISDDAEILMRSEQAKIFPSNSDPPEETLELVMNGQKSLARMDALQTFRCLINQTKGRQRLKDFINVLMCLEKGVCTSVRLEPSQARMCLRAQCFSHCMRQSEPALCLRTSCLTPALTEDEQSPYVTAKRSSSQVGDMYPEMEKRYRLGLYDCISSYCGELHGEDRKSCIVNYCHRSSTI